MHGKIIILLILMIIIMLIVGSFVISIIFTPIYGEESILMSFIGGVRIVEICSCI